MNVFLLYVFLFFLGSTFGWVLELFFRRFKTSNVEHKWVNPGFLNGPYLPIYGFGLCALYTMSLIDGLFTFPSEWLHVLVLFFGIGFVMTLIELIGGEIFIIGFKVKLWDYSKRWLNYKGIICPLFFFIWAALGTVYYFFINPYIIDAINWFNGHPTFSFILGVFFGVFILDVVYSCNLVVKIRNFAKKNGLLVKYEEFKESIGAVKNKYLERNRFFLSLVAASHRVRESLDDYKDKVKQRYGEKVNGCGDAKETSETPQNNAKLSDNSDSSDNVSVKDNGNSSDDAHSRNDAGVRNNEKSADKADNADVKDGKKSSKDKK